MNRTSLAVLLVWFWLELSASAQAQAGSDNKMEDLVRQCEQNGGAAEKDETKQLVGNIMGTGYCVGFFNGLLDASSIAQSVLGKPLFCLPDDGISGDQAIKIYLKYAKDHPEQLHQSARVT